MPSSAVTKGDLVPIQVVFQGGGARLCVLMAVCDVLQEYQTENWIRINRLAGSSAGAIAAAMLASKKKTIGTFRAELQHLGPLYLAKMKLETPRLEYWFGPGTSWVAQRLAAWRVYRGGPYFTGFDLEPFFEELFYRDEPKCVKDLEPETNIYFTDLYSLGARPAAKDEPLAKALAKSCRLPFAFVGHGSGNTEVDGGLALNLPVDDLAKETEKGPVIGIGFVNKYGKSKGGLISYTQQLFSAAIQSSVTRSETLLGKQNVYPIDTDIGTFDFEYALTEGFGKAYKSTADHFRSWLDTWLHPYRPIERASRLIRPPLSNNPMHAAVIREIDEYSEMQPATRAKSLLGFETAVLDEAGHFTGKYFAKTIMTFSIVRPTNIMIFEFQTGTGGSFTASTLGCTAFDRDGISLRFVLHVQEITKERERLRTFRVYFFFDEQLKKDSPNEPYVVEYRCEADDPYPALGTRPEFSLVARLGGADEAIQAVAFPRAKFRRPPKIQDIATVGAERLKELDCENEALVASDGLDPSGYLHSMDFGHHSPEEYHIVVRRVRDIKHGQSYGFVIE